ncbi:MAG TPA: hypothetical protein VKQ29_05615 [Aliidongia sp.]|nr:hypothetical protein [Aliidongia sp.]
MAVKPAPKPDDRDQRQKFIDTARELGCNEDEAAFEEALKKIAPHKPETEKPRRD